MTDPIIPDVRPTIPNIIVPGKDGETDYLLWVDQAIMATPKRGQMTMTVDFAAYEIKSIDGDTVTLTKGYPERRNKTYGPADMPVELQQAIAAFLYQAALSDGAVQFQDLLEQPEPEPEVEE